uniref:Uncharacterized protein n=1 Tax=Trieres chinensis TaxID=1514140 RepID=A0A7S2EYF6_TRICV|mmetsp:Transcript_9711/g.20536  ORF Transcript_9711/g.20536 Transcript_9711/m.20536 type:complete len:104 (+) Transcript_9711:133-444(+)
MVKKGKQWKRSDQLLTDELWESLLHRNGEFDLFSSLILGHLQSWFEKMVLLPLVSLLYFAWLLVLFGDARLMIITIHGTLFIFPSKPSLTVDLWENLLHRNIF